MIKKQNATEIIVNFLEKEGFDGLVNVNLSNECIKKYNFKETKLNLLELNNYFPGYLDNNEQISIDYEILNYESRDYPKTKCPYINDINIGGRNCQKCEFNKKVDKDNLQIICIYKLRHSAKIEDPTIF